VKTVIGAGILGLPFSVGELGYVMAIIVFLIVGLVNHFSAVLLINAKNLSGHSNYSSILYHIFRHKFSKALASLVIFLNNMGICNQTYIFRYSLNANDQINYQKNSNRSFRKR